jgi:hypothetical protein
MIYPIYEKHISEDPYFTLYYYFRKLLYHHDIYVVIGYSFRDPSINAAFADALNNRSDSRMIIINSNRNNIQRRINEKFPSEKCDLVEIPFGSDNLLPRLEELL